MRLTQKRLERAVSLHLMRRESKPNPWPEIKGLIHNAKK